MDMNQQQDPGEMNDIELEAFLRQRAFGVPGEEGEDQGQAEEPAGEQEGGQEEPGGNEGPSHEGSEAGGEPPAAPPPQAPQQAPAISDQDARDLASYRQAENEVRRQQGLDQLRQQIIDQHGEDMGEQLFQQRLKDLGMLNQQSEQLKAEAQAEAALARLQAYLSAYAATDPQFTEKLKHIEKTLPPGMLGSLQQEAMKAQDPGAFLNSFYSTIMPPPDEITKKIAQKAGDLATQKIRVEPETQSRSITAIPNSPSLEPSEKEIEGFTDQSLHRFLQGRLKSK